MKKLVGISIVMLLSLWFLLLSGILSVVTYHTTTTQYTNRIKGNIVSAETKGARTDYTVEYSVSGKDYTTNFSMYLYDLKDCELLLDDANNVVNLGITYDFCVRTYFYCKYIIKIAGICLLISFILFEFLGRGAKSSERRKKEFELCEKV